MKNKLALIRSLMVCSFCLLYFVPGCERVKYLGDPIVSFSGYVKDAITDQVVDSAWIDFDSLPPYYVYSDSTGYYIYGDFGYPPEDFHIFVGKQDYFMKETLIHIPSNKWLIDSVVIYLEPFESIE